MLSIIKLFRAIGYNNPHIEDGLCYGIACMAARAMVMGQYKQYLKRMSYIYNNYDNLTRKLKDYVTGVALDHKLNAFELDVLAWMEGILLFQGINVAESHPNLNTYDFEMLAALSHQNHRMLPTKLSLLSRPGLDLSQKHHAYRSVVNQFTLRNVSGLIEAIRESSTPVAYLLSGLGHAIMIGGCKEQVYFVDHDEHNRIISKKDFFYKTHFNLFGCEIGECSANACILIPFSEASSLLLSEFMRSFPVSCLTSSDDGTPRCSVLGMALKSDDHPLVFRCMETIFKSTLSYDAIKVALGFKKINEMDDLEVAFYRGNSQAIQMYVSELLASNLSFNDKQDLLFTSNQWGAKCLRWAFSKQHHDAIEAYVDAIKESKLESKMKCILLKKMLHEIIDTISLEDLRAHPMVLFTLYISIRQLDSRDVFKRAGIFNCFQYSKLKKIEVAQKILNFTRCPDQPLALTSRQREIAEQGFLGRICRLTDLLNRNEAASFKTSPARS